MAERIETAAKWMLVFAAGYLACACWGKREQSANGLIAAGWTILDPEGHEIAWFGAE